MNYSPRVTAGIFIVLLLSVWSSLEAFRFTRQYNESFKDPLGFNHADERYAPLRAALPASVVEIGYVSDKQQEDAKGGAMFFAAQYALTPHILLREKEMPKHEWVIGNFTALSDFNEVARLLGVTLFKDFGEGLVLFRKVPGQPVPAARPPTPPEAK